MVRTSREERMQVPRFDRIVPHLLDALRLPRLRAQLLERAIQRERQHLSHQLQARHLLLRQASAVRLFPLPPAQLLLLLLRLHRRLLELQHLLRFFRPLVDKSGRRFPNAKQLVLTFDLYSCLLQSLMTCEEKIKR